MNLPPLPEPDICELTPIDPPTAYSAKRLREYGESCARMAREEERERCAQICDDLQPPFGLEVMHSPEDCAYAIRKVHPQDVDRQKAIEQSRAIRKG